MCCVRMYWLLLVLKVTVISLTSPVSLRSVGWVDHTVPQQTSHYAMYTRLYPCISVQEVGDIKPVYSLRITPNVKVMQIVDLGMYVYGCSS